jgi:hypothetical protein
MSKTIAESFVDKGKQQQAQEDVLMLLQTRFKKVPSKLKTRVASTTDIRQLKAWMANIVQAKSIADVGIPLD